MAIISGVVLYWLGERRLFLWGQLGGRIPDLLFRVATIQLLARPRRTHVTQGDWRSQRNLECRQGSQFSGFRALRMRVFLCRAGDSDIEDWLA
ncbi:hypothetical protein FE257_000941 [Aspergillus nanangensis]|uniref:Uncharacterized protein n=1 Tax=Aspergillus nanangensis TaxID=2582783 RepID=A0AAD4CEB3_ASPNN|nr:hypothetical protein FE257_000941 [Aspergillus nanangensis]